MPQLMPFIWINSLFMVIFIFWTLSILYFYKNEENMSMKIIKSEMILNFYLTW